MTPSELKSALENLDDLERKASSGMPTNAKYRALDLASRPLIRPMLDLLAECRDWVSSQPHLSNCLTGHACVCGKDALLAKLPAKEKP